MFVHIFVSFFLYFFAFTEVTLNPFVPSLPSRRSLLHTWALSALIKRLLLHQLTLGTATPGKSNALGISSITTMGVPMYRHRLLHKDVQNLFLLNHLQCLSHHLSHIGLIMSLLYTGGKQLLHIHSRTTLPKWKSTADGKRRKGRK